MLRGRGMAATFDAGILLFEGPRLRAGVDGDSSVLPQLKERGRGVIQGVKFFGEVGGTAELLDKVLPGGGLFILLHKVAN